MKIPLSIALTLLSLYSREQTSSSERSTSFPFTFITKGLIRELHYRKFEFTFTAMVNLLVSAASFIEHDGLLA